MTYDGYVGWDRTPWVYAALVAVVVAGTVAVSQHVRGRICVS